MKNSKKKIWMIMLFVILLFVSLGGVFAAYVSRSYVKGVATTPKQGFILSSDYLVVTSKNSTQDQYSKKKILMDEKSQNDDTPYIFTFDVRNSQYNMIFGKSIIYTLHINGLPDGVSIYRDEVDITNDIKEGGAEAPRMWTFTKEIHKYKVVIPKELMSAGSEFTITAIPSDDSDSSGNMLALKVQLSVAGKIAGFSYKGYFLDKTMMNHPYDFAAFNYAVAVSNAAEDHTMVLTWDPNYVEIDPFFLNDNNLTPYYQDGKMKVEFTMGSSQDSYLIKFYRLKGQSNSQDDTWQHTWEGLENIIQFGEK